MSSSPYLLVPLSPCRLWWAGARKRACPTLRIWTFLIVGLFPPATSAIAADEPPAQPKDETPIKKITIYPAAEPRPALRYRLLPPLIDLRPGNAAVFYNKAALMARQQQGADKQQNQASEWIELPLDRLPRGEVAATVRAWEGILQQVGYAVLREECDWQMPLREGFPYGIVLPEAQEMRSVVRILAVKARLEIAEGRYDDAIETLRTGYTVARHVAQGPFFVHVLIGIAAASVMTEQARELAQQSGAPNLYWAYGSLPQPFISLDLANQYEKDSLFFWHPEWRDLDHQTWGPEGWQKIYDEMVDSLQEIDSDQISEHRSLQVLGRAVQRYGHAKRWLIEHGSSAEAVELMPVAQVVVLYTVGLYNELSDESMKWANLAYPEIVERWSAAEQAIHDEARKHEIIPFAGLLSGPYRHVRQAQVRLERLFALERTIEALRVYAAAHDGKLPKQLADVTEAPVPGDPWMGGPFDYELQGETATLKARLPSDMSAKHLGVHYEITVGEP
ncbi:MAG TPA: hypothetical protein VFI31_11830 [Pirellulales bacterium]|nr:hypothetical protein [Pirellulales bacterium]